MSRPPHTISESDIARLAATVEAPQSLHRRVQEMVADAQQPPVARRARWALPSLRLARPAAAGAALAAAAAAAVLVAVALSGGGGSPALTPRAAAALALGPATLPAPGESASHRNELAASVGGVAFPYWRERFGWRDSGARRDTLGGHAITTVFYSNPSGERIGYAIAAGPATTTGGGALVRRWGVAYRLSAQDGAEVIAWRRGGHLCVMAGRGVSRRTLLDLASWGSRRAGAA
jgi:hypothetical protein